MSELIFNVLKIPREWVHSYSEASTERSRLTMILVLFWVMLVMLIQKIVCCGGKVVWGGRSNMIAVTLKFPPPSLP